MRPLFYKFIPKFKQSIQLRLTVYFLVILLPLIALSLFANYRSQRILEQKVNEQSTMMLASVLVSINAMLQNTDTLSMGFATDPNLIENLARSETEDATERMFELRKVIEQLSSYNASNNVYSQIAIYHPATQSMLSSKYGSMRTEGYENQSWYTQALEGNGKSMLLIPQQGDYSNVQQRDPAFHPGNVTILRPMEPFKHSDSKNVLMITLNNAFFARELKQLVQFKSESAHLFSGDGKLVSDLSSKESSPRWENDALIGSSQPFESSGRNLLLRYRSPENGWSLVVVKPKKLFYSETNHLRIFTITIIAVSFLLALLVSWVLYRGISKPLAALAYGMKELRVGRLDTSLPMQRQDEFGYLMKAFNQMAQEQKHLIEDIYEQQLLRLKAELSVLQSQINPHFLYNTLDSVYRIAENYGVEEISEMALNLSKFFRLSLSKGQDEFTVDETIQHLHYYMRVQQLRFVDKLSVTVHVEEASKPLPLLKLLLQPLVENAILHGVEKKAKGGHVNIDCRLDRDRLRVEVSDNGKGMSPERLKLVRDELDILSIQSVKGMLQNRQEIKGQQEIYGLWNVKARLMLYYGEGAKLTVDSEKDVGTSVTIWIPFNRTS